MKMTNLETITKTTKNFRVWPFLHTDILSQLRNVTGLHPADIVCYNVAFKIRAQCNNSTYNYLQKDELDSRCTNTTKLI